MSNPVYELSGLHARLIDGQFYNYEHVNVTILNEKEFQIDRIVRTRNKGGIKQHLIKRRGYDETFNSWVEDSDINRI
jgi:hypothetical protein